jgi:mRNA interferase MazF
LQYRFEDRPNQYKERPVVVGAISRETAEVSLLAVKVTSHAARAEFPGEVVLQDWQQAGLEKPSVARCSKHMVVPVEVLMGQRRYGKLSTRDALAVEEALKEVGAPLV